LIRALCGVVILHLYPCEAKLNSADSF